MIPSVVERLPYGAIDHDRLQLGVVQPGIEVADRVGGKSLGLIGQIGTFAGMSMMVCVGKACKLTYKVGSFVCNFLYVHRAKIQYSAILTLKAMFLSVMVTLYASALTLTGISSIGQYSWRILKHGIAKSLYMGDVLFRGVLGLKIRKEIAVFKDSHIVKDLFLPRKVRKFNELLLSGDYVAFCPKNEKGEPLPYLLLHNKVKGNEIRSWEEGYCLSYNEGRVDVVDRNVASMPLEPIEASQIRDISDMEESDLPATRAKQFDELLRSGDYEAYCPKDLNYRPQPILRLREKMKNAEIKAGDNDKHYLEHTNGVVRIIHGMVASKLITPTITEHSAYAYNLNETLYQKKRDLSTLNYKLTGRIDEQYNDDVTPLCAAAFKSLFSFKDKILSSLQILKVMIRTLIRFLINNEFIGISVLDIVRWFDDLEEQIELLEFVESTISQKEYFDCRDKELFLSEIEEEREVLEENLEKAWLLVNNAETNISALNRSGCQETRESGIDRIVNDISCKSCEIMGGYRLRKLEQSKKDEVELARNTWKGWFLGAEKEETEAKSMINNEKYKLYKKQLNILSIAIACNNKRLNDPSKEDVDAVLRKAYSSVEGDLNSLYS
jgi:hypothetical protein